MKKLIYKAFLILSFIASALSLSGATQASEAPPRVEKFKPALNQNSGDKLYFSEAMSQSEISGSLAWHYSHSSHQSHQSHQSHYSHRSGW
ncbi:MAG: hypothetical protein LBV23_02965 [Deltaproteobacteria bacterium]|jgi:hypothetical protein|nr:hypothetical protein [Deltaproteobacteria bacterium]